MEENIDEWQDIEKAEVKDAQEIIQLKENPIELITKAFNQLREDFDNHSHCLKCHRFMEISEKTRDGVCLRENCGKINRTGPRIV